MINLKKIKIEYIISALFGILALILSLLVGIILRNGIALVLQRAFVTTILFSIVGIACILVIKKFVPEVYQLLSSINSSEGSEIKADLAFKPDDAKKETPGMRKSPASDVPAEANGEDAELENEFNTLEKQQAEYSSAGMEKKDSTLISKDVLKDKKIKYEPKIAAQAIRTMMKRDE